MILKGLLKPNNIRLLLADFEDDVLHDGVNLYKYPKRANVKPGYELAPLGLTPSEIDACLKPSSTKSLRILGFQLRSWIKAVWQIKDPLFLSLAGRTCHAWLLCCIYALSHTIFSLR